MILNSLLKLKFSSSTRTVTDQDLNTTDGQISRKHSGRREQEHKQRAKKTIYPSKEADINTPDQPNKGDRERGK